MAPRDDNGDGAANARETSSPSILKLRSRSTQMKCPVCLRNMRTRVQGPDADWWAKQVMVNILLVGIPLLAKPWRSEVYQQSCGSCGVLYGTHIYVFSEFSPYQYLNEISNAGSGIESPLGPVDASNSIERTISRSKMLRYGFLLTSHRSGKAYVCEDGLGNQSYCLLVSFPSWPTHQITDGATGNPNVILYRDKEQDDSIGTGICDASSSVHATVTVRGATFILEQRPLSQFRSEIGMEYFRLPSGGWVRWERYNWEDARLYDAYGRVCAEMLFSGMSKFVFLLRPEIVNNAGLLEEIFVSGPAFYMLIQRHIKREQELATRISKLPDTGR